MYTEVYFTILYYIIKFCMIPNFLYFPSKRFYYCSFVSVVLYYILFARFGCLTPYAVIIILHQAAFQYMYTQKEIDES